MFCVLAFLSILATLEGPLQVTATVIRPIQVRVSPDGAVTFVDRSLFGAERIVEPRIARRPGLVSIDF